MDVIDGEKWAANQWVTVDELVPSGSRGMSTEDIDGSLGTERSAL